MVINDYLCIINAFGMDDVKYYTIQDAYDANNNMLNTILKYHGKKIMTRK